MQELGLGLELFVKRQPGSLGKIGKVGSWQGKTWMGQSSFSTITLGTLEARHSLRWGPSYVLKGA